MHTVPFRLVCECSLPFSALLSIKEQCGEAGQRVAATLDPPMLAPDQFRFDWQLISHPHEVCRKCAPAENLSS